MDIENHEKRITTNKQSIDNIHENSVEYEGGVRKLPVWGVDIPIPNSYVFQWPTDEMLAQMQDDVKLTSIEFSTHKESFNLASVKVSYSDGSSSPNIGYEVPS